MYRIPYFLIQPGVVSTGLIGTAVQVGLAFANSFNVAGLGDSIAQYGLSGQLASGGLIAALVGAYYSFTQRKTGHAVATGAGAVAGGISGTLGTAVTQALGWTAVTAGTTPLLNFSAIAAGLIALVASAGATPVDTTPMFDAETLTGVFASTAAGGGVGALLGRTVFGGRAKRRRHAHA